MANFNEFKKKAAETAETIADKSVEIAKILADKTKEITVKAKIKAELLAEKEALKKGYQELGKLYYEKAVSEADENILQAINCITQTLERIEAKNAELEALGADDAAEADIEVEIYETEEAEEECCCGEETCTCGEEYCECEKTCECENSTEEKTEE